MNNDIVRLNKIMNNLVKYLKIYGFNVILKGLKLSFKVLYFLKVVQIFVGSVHDFGKLDNDIYFTRMIFMSGLIFFKFTMLQYYQTTEPVSNILPSKIFSRYIIGLMSNLIKKSCAVSN